MRKVLFLYNPLSGGGREGRNSDVEAAASVLRSTGVKVDAVATQGAAEAGDQARAAVPMYDVIFACGGDGTIHDILQGLAQTTTPLGIIPLGTANTLAHDLGLPLDHVGAARAALTAKPRRIALGRVRYSGFDGHPAERYFTVAVGVGVDAHLFYKLNALAKRHLGMAAYYWKATHLWLTYPLDHFRAEVSSRGQIRQLDVSQVLAVRIRFFGGVLRELAPGASLVRNDLRLVLFHTQSRFTYLRYILRGLLGTTWRGKGIELANAESVHCRALSDSHRVFVEADGELIGTLPAEISILPDALTLLSPG
ncbi:MAG TPA: diacylglycerol kinase family protein [Terriglobales bacterium]|nr:diacylglycerol kinase family protein [Terriglobales bacterium]